MVGFARSLGGLSCAWLLACSHTAADGGGAGAVGGAGSSSAGRDSVAGSSSRAGEGGQAAGSPGLNSAGQGGEGETAAELPVGGASGGGGDSGAADFEAILAQYRGWQARSEPQNVSGYIFGLCRLPTLPEQAFAESEHGDGRYLQDWVNSEAASGLAASGKPAFPVGSVIVKEKYTFVDPDAQLDLVAIGIMVKRPVGFAPAHADWDYGYYEPALGIIQSSEQSSYCADCHANAADTDHVYVLGLGPASAP